MKSIVLSDASVERLRAGELVTVRKVKLDKIPVFDKGEKVQVGLTRLVVEVQSVSHDPPTTGDLRGYWSYVLKVSS